MKAFVKVKDCTNESFVGINVTTDKEGNYHLDLKRAIEGVIKAAKLSGAKTQKLPYPVDGKSLSKEDNAKDDAEIREVAKTPFRALNTLSRTSHMPSTCCLGDLSNFCIIFGIVLLG